MKKALTILLIIIKRKEVRQLMAEITDMYKKIDKAVKEAKQDSNISKAEKKNIAKVALEEFGDINEIIINII